MPQKKPEVLGFGNSELRKAVLKLLDSGIAKDFNAAFARVMHARGIFHSREGQRETYNFYFRRIKPLVTTALNARKLQEQRAMKSRSKPAVTNKAPLPYFVGLLIQGQLSEFTKEPNE